MENVYLLYFSVGGTGKKVVENIAKGFPQDANVSEVDLTVMENRKKLQEFGKEDLVLFSVMTMSDVFGPEDLFENLKGNDTALVCVAMCGNQYTGVAIPRMRKDLEKQGFRTVAAATFVGKHSCEDGLRNERPDAKDLTIAKNFGKKIWYKLTVENKKELKEKIRADRPKIKSPTSLWSNIKISAISSKKTTVNPLVNSWCKFEVDDKCVGCRLCSKKCPMEAIIMNGKIPIHDKSKCIGCFRCVNICPMHSTHNTSKTLHFFAKEALTYTERKEPVIHI